MAADAAVVIAVAVADADAYAADVVASIAAHFDIVAAVLVLIDKFKIGADDSGERTAVAAVVTIVNCYLYLCCFCCVCCCCCFCCC